LAAVVLQGTRKQYVDWLPRWSAAGKAGQILSIESGDECTAIADQGA
jgi:hypothetical protein